MLPRRRRPQSSKFTEPERDVCLSVCLSVCSRYVQREHLWLLVLIRSTERRRNSDPVRILPVDSSIAALSNAQIKGSQSAESSDVLLSRVLFVWNVCYVAYSIVS